MAGHERLAQSALRATGSRPDVPPDHAGPLRDVPWPPRVVIDESIAPPERERAAPHEHPIVQDGDGEDGRAAAERGEASAASVGGELTPRWSRRRASTASSKQLERLPGIGPPQRRAARAPSPARSCRRGPGAGGRHPHRAGAHPTLLPLPRALRDRIPVPSARPTPDATVPAPGRRDAARSGGRRGHRRRYRGLLLRPRGATQSRWRVSTPPTWTSTRCGTRASHRRCARCASGRIPISRATARRSRSSRPCVLERRDAS